MRTVIESIRNHGAWSGAVTFPGQRERLTWRELHLKALRMATVLRAQGVSRDSVVMLPGETAPNVVAAIQAVWLCGAAISISPSAGDAVAVSELAAQAESASLAQPSDPDPADLAVLQYTSGSIRMPQGVAITHGNLAANLTAIRAASGHAAWHPGPLLSWLPLYHDMGLIGFLALPMSCGCDLVLLAPATFAAHPAGSKHLLVSPARAGPRHSPRPKRSL